MSPSVQSMQFAGLKSCDTTDDTIMTTIFEKFPSRRRSARSDLVNDSALVDVLEPVKHLNHDGHERPPLVIPERSGVIRT